jgi:hypothetical protein
MYPGPTYASNVLVMRKEGEEGGREGGREEGEGW